MEEYRCKNSGALLFSHGPAENEFKEMKKENLELKKRLDTLESLIKKSIKKTPKKKPVKKDKK